MSDKPAAGSDSKENGQSGEAAKSGTRPPGELTVSLDDSNSPTNYANFFRITSTPEEVVIDLGLNTAGFGPGHATIKVTDRVVINYYTAKRLLAGLNAAVQRHEQTFGVLETDVRKRVKSMPK